MLRVNGLRIHVAGTQDWKRRLFDPTARIPTALPAAAWRCPESDRPLARLIAPAQAREHIGEIRRQGRPQDQGRIAHGMPQAQFHRRQQQAPATEQFLEQAVVPALAMGGIADDGVGDVLHVAAQLMPAAGRRQQFHQGVAAGGIAVDPVGQFHPRQATIAGHGGPGSA